MIIKRRNGFSRECQWLCMKGISDTSALKCLLRLFILRLCAFYLCMQSQYGTGRFSPERKKPAALLQRVSLIRSLAMSYFHMANATLSSALFRFTTEFGMESGGSKTLLSPSKMRGKDSRQSASRLRVLCAR